MSNHAVLPLPITAESLTSAWLTAALNDRYPGVEVTASRVVDVICGTSTKIRMALEYNAVGQAAGLPPTLMVKGGFEEHSPRMAFMYEVEMRYYRDLVPVLAYNVPKCYFTSKDPDSHQAIVIMEDLDAKGVTFCRAERPLNYAQVSGFLDGLAQLHAQWWDHPDLRDDGKYGWVQHTFSPDAWNYANHYLVPETWATLMTQPRGAAVSQRLHDRDWMLRALRHIEAMHRDSPHTFVHGDTHLGNLYLEADGKPGFIDAQMHREVWYQDVTYHLIGALDPVDRRAWEKPLLAYYLERLKAYGVARPPSFDEAWELYKREITYGLFIFMQNENWSLKEATNTVMAMRFGVAAIDHHLRDLIP
jgi:hypothetical protein